MSRYLPFPKGWASTVRCMGKWVVASKVPLPNYRPDLDDKRPQREVVVPLRLQRRVEGLLQEHLDRFQLKGSDHSENKPSTGEAKNVDVQEIADSFVDGPVMEKVLQKRSLRMRNMQRAWQFYAQSLSSAHGSPGITLDGDSVRMIVHLTLLGLINEIMSKGRRMTYEELCYVVLPHWHNLRKHNGERYAYSSHSQAVLDCLRNRYEWTRLVDRGPKTNLNRKRRKLQAEELDDNEWSESRWAKVEGMNLDYPKEDFPKGKRKARKCRRLALP